MAQREPKSRARAALQGTRQRLAWAAGLAALLVVLGAAFATFWWARERRSNERLALASLECAARDHASERLQSSEFWREHAPGPRGTPFDLFRMSLADRMAVRECALAHRLFDAMAAASPHDSFVVSPHAVYASALLSAAAGNEAMVRQLLELSAGPQAAPAGDFAEELAWLKTDRALFDPVALESPLARRFPNRYDLSFTLHAALPAQLAPAFVSALRAVGAAVAIEAQDPLSGAQATADLTLSSNFSIAGAWFDTVLPERDGEFQDATGRRVPARFLRVARDQFTSAEYAQRGELRVGDAAQALRLVFISLGGERPMTDFCDFQGLPGDYSSVTLEVPELALATVTNAATCAAALGDLVTPEHGARYACAYVPTPRFDVTERDLAISMSSNAALAFTQSGISWTAPGPTPDDFPVPKNVEIALQAREANAPPRTLTFDRPFLFAVLDPFGLVHAVGRVATLPAPRAP